MAAFGRSTPKAGVREPFRPGPQLSGDEKLGRAAMALRDDGQFCIIHEEEQTPEPQIICSIGLDVGGIANA